MKNPPESAGWAGILWLPTRRRASTGATTRHGESLHNDRIRSRCGSVKPPRDGQRRLPSQESSHPDDRRAPSKKFLLLSVLSRNPMFMTEAASRPRRLRFIQLDVFSARPLEGNPLAVFPDADGLSDEEMQA